MSDGAQINVSFQCTAPGCDCQSVVSARVIVRSNGERFYEHTNRCPSCGHKLSKHVAGGELARLPARESAQKKPGAR